ncbi:MAG: hypothetical protein ACC656_14730, partial [Candidatus Heimdallarchaeota archaeon]
VVYVLKVINLQDLLFLDLIEFVIIGNFVIYYTVARASYNNKTSIDSYELPEIKGLKYIIYFIIGLIPLILILTIVLIASMSSIYSTGAGKLLNIALLGIGVSINSLFAAFVLLFYLRGDHPIQQKITELEIREELLEMAREFRELDPSNIDDFVRKSGSKMI